MESTHSTNRHSTRSWVQFRKGPDSPTFPLGWSQLGHQVSEGTSVPHIRQHLNSLSPTLHGEHSGYWSSHYTKLGSVQRRSTVLHCLHGHSWGIKCSIHQAKSKESVSYTTWRALVILIVTVHTVGVSSEKVQTLLHFLHVGHSWGIRRLKVRVFHTSGISWIICSLHRMDSTRDTDRQSTPHG